MGRRLIAHQIHPLGFKHAQHARKLMSALQHSAIGGEHAPGPLLACVVGPFLDLIQRRFAMTAIDTEQRAFGQRVERIIAPLARGHLLAVEVE